jgi:Zn finger protein HypA/HybF involved in hydrogenase expression
MEPARNREAVPCPLCDSDTGLEIALRLELETESEQVFAACVDCNRLYEITPDGSLRLETTARYDLAVQRVVCPKCTLEGSVLTYSLPEAQAESHLLVTCPDCRFVFKPEA